MSHLLIKTLWAQDESAPVGSTDYFVDYAPQLKAFVRPQSEGAEAAVQELMKYQL